MDFRPRIIPVLLLRGRALVKTREFEGGVYLGDAINTINIFNEKMVDELMVLDIDASREGRRPNVDLLAELASECFVPFCYGGGIRDAEEARILFQTGVEKISINTAFHDGGSVVGDAARLFGTQSVSVCIDVRRTGKTGYEVFTESGRRASGLDPVAQARKAALEGAGEIVVQSIDRDGLRNGYDLELIARIVEAVDVPVVALGGASSMDDMAEAVVTAGAAAAAAGSLFVFYGRLQAVLINVPDEAARAAAFARKRQAPAGKAENGAVT